MELLQELVWQKLGPWMRRVWWKLESWRRCSLFREREGKPSWLLFCSVHLCPQSLNLPGRQLAREPAWCTFQNTRRLGNECVQLHILALLIFLAQPPLLPPLHTLHFISGNSFQFPATYCSLWVCTSYHPNSERPEKRSPFCLLPIAWISPAMLWVSA